MFALSRTVRLIRHAIMHATRPERVSGAVVLVLTFTRRAAVLTGV